MYNTLNLRTLEEDHTPTFKIRNDRSSTLICIKGNGNIFYARTRLDKDAMISNMNWEEDVLLWPWVGKWCVDVFRLRKEDIDKAYA